MSAWSKVYLSVVVPIAIAVIYLPMDVACHGLV
jgi:hypothetical protein